MALPVVSVCIMTYQHINFIAQAIEGALMQKTDFPVEILIGEDESDDGTRKICLAYADKYPDRISVFQRSRKDVVLIDGQPRGGANLRATIHAAKGDFIALCEGDDYWTDPEKLQRQIDYLRSHAKCVGCFHDTSLVDSDGKIIQSSYFQSRKKTFDQKAVLATLMSSYPTCSLVFRREAFDPLPDWFIRRPCDLYLDIHLTSKGSLGFINRNMGAYRKHAGGIWSKQRAANQLIELIIRYKLLLSYPYFLQKYRDLLLLKIDEFQQSLFTRTDVANEVSSLDVIIQKQGDFIAVLKAERDRHSAEAEQARTDAKQAALVAQKHIDSLRAQLDQLAATSTKQTEYIAVMERERDRHAAEAKQTRAEAKQAALAAQKHIDGLRAQLERTVAEHAQTVTTLQSQLARATHDSQNIIDPLRAQLDQLAATSAKQTEYIAVMERERDRHAAEAKQTRAEAKQAALAAQKHIDDLRAQLSQLAVTSNEQNQYISILKREVDRLTAAASQASTETERLGKVVVEQTTYINVLQRQCNQGSTAT